MCLDWILASTEYIEFVYMMLEFKVSILEKWYVCVRGLKTGTEKTTSTKLARPTSMAVRTRRTTRLEEGLVELLVKLNCAVMMI